MTNRSAPTGPVVPCLTYPDVDRAIAWLTGAFGFTERLRTPAEPDGSVHHAQVSVGAGAIILTTGQGAAGTSLFVPVADVDGHCEQTRSFGARILLEPHTCEFGERQYTAEDLAGYRWTFSQSIADVDPTEWGAQVSKL